MLHRNIGSIENGGSFQDVKILEEPPFYTTPPIYADDPLIKPDPYYDGSDEVLLRFYIYKGQVIDAYSKGIPGATVLLMLGDKQISGQATDSNGNFVIKTATKPDSIVISSAGYKSWQWPAYEDQHVFELQPDVKEIDPVILPPGKKPDNTFLWLALAGIVIYKMSSK